MGKLKFSCKISILTIVIAFVVYKVYLGPKPRAPIVKTELGRLEGVISISRDGREYFEYLGIPYAKPPVGDLRFEDPVDAEAWVGVRSADKYGNECIQKLIGIGLGFNIGNEDCLFLNVFTPKKSSSRALLPTLVFIHGGLFMEGSANMYRPDYFMDQDVVLVTFNYRLSAFGFLNTGDGVIRGNAGLKDQASALRFVQRNIAQFGGDPKRVTLFGQSAGGSSVHFHVLSSYSQGLFQKAIAQSGSAMSPWTMARNAKKQARRLGATLKCPTDSTLSMIECLKKLPAKEIVETFSEAMNPLREADIIYLPTIEAVNDERTFIGGRIKDLMTLKSGIPLMTGVTSHDGLVIRALLDRNETLKLHLSDPKNWLETIPNMMHLTNVTFENLHQLRQYYFGNEIPVDLKKHEDNVTNLLSDIYFNYGFIEAATHHSNHSPVYVYQFSYPGENSLYNLLASVKEDYPPLLEIIYFVVKKLALKHIFGVNLPHYGVAHADELPLLFKLDMLCDIKPRDVDYEMSKKLVKLWTSFAIDENLLEIDGIAWKSLNFMDPDFMLLNIAQQSEYTKAAYADRIHFLKSNIFKS